MTASFYAPAPERPRDDVLEDYLAFLERRNGSIDPSAPYPAREKWLEAADGSAVRHKGSIDPERFQRCYARFDGAEAPLAMVALLSFVKMNAGEAYGVEVLTRRRHHGPPSGLLDTVERVLAREETYHTRILAGATGQFGVPRPAGGWRPPIPLRLLIGTLAYSPKALFHPILLGAEIGGVFTFHWMLEKVGEVFRDEPALKETLEARLEEILVDELGHIAFNRMAVGQRGIAVAKSLAGRVAHATSGLSPEFRILGWTPDTIRAMERFDFDALPEDVRRRAFFV